MLKENFIFLGSSLLSLGTLESMYAQAIVPKIVITGPDKPVGRNLKLTENLISKWVKEKNVQREKNLEEEIILIKPEKINTISEVETIKNLIVEENIKFGLVASYGKILTEEFLNLFKHGIINIHPSDLPSYRGPSPIESQVLDSLENITISIMQMSKGMDEGDIWYKEAVQIDFEKIDLNIDILEYDIGFIGGNIFGKIINKIINKEIESVAQESGNISYTRKYKKIDGNITLKINNIKTLNQAKLENLRDERLVDLEIYNLMTVLFKKYIAFSPWPGIYFEHKYMDKKNQNTQEKTIKVKISKMSFDKTLNEIKIVKLIPESKKEINLFDFENVYGRIF